jgi:hypothetical protein
VHDVSTRAHDHDVAPAEPLLDKPRLGERKRAAARSYSHGPGLS